MEAGLDDTNETFQKTFSRSETNITNVSEK